jgi:UDP-N-acetyl-D-mannosaminuronic acid dehydrogenase
LKQHKRFSICILGLGYIGLPTASLLATVGNSVYGVDVKGSVIDAVNSGEGYLNEPDLSTLIRGSVASGNLLAGERPRKAEVFMIAVPTPFKENKEPDLASVEKAVRAFAPSLRKGNLVILESTSPVGTTEEVVGRILQEETGLVPGEDFYLAYCPERVLPGQIVKELVSNDRVLGGINPESAERAAELYRTFVQGELVLTDCRTAEMCKLVENAYRDVNIAFANEISMICSRHGVNERELIRYANRHPRVNILSPGPGVGGHCIAVDPWFLVAKDPDLASLVRTAREVNMRKQSWVIDQICATEPKSRSIGCFGLTYKPDVEDLRESPALEIARALQKEGYPVYCCEPNCSEVEGLTLCSLKETLEKSDLLLFLVAHREFRGLSLPPGKRTLDCVGIL